MSRPIAVILGLALLVVGGFVHGLYAERWQTSSALDEAVAAIVAVPKSIGGWEGVDQATDAKEFALAGARGFWSRIYQKDGQEFLAIGDERHDDGGRHGAAAPREPTVDG